MAQAGELNVIEFGPARAIGMAMIAKGGSGDFFGLWQTQLFPRAAEVSRPEHAAAFGVCRCVPGATDGSFEYLALLQATASAAVPAGMIAVDIPQSHYAIFQVPSLPELGKGWQEAFQAVSSQTDWTPYCGPNGCQCATHPSFEYHAWDSRQTGKIFIYIPVKRA